MGTASRRRPASVYTSSPDELDLEFTPLLPQRRRGADCRPRAACPKTQSTAVPQRTGAKARRVVRWHEMAFGTVRVPAAMDMGEIRRRLREPRRRDDDDLEALGRGGWAPWRLIRSLSCKGIEAVAVAAASAPVRLV